MIQDIYPHKLYNQFEAEAVANPDSKVLCFSRGNVFVNVENGLKLPTVKELGEEKEYTYLFRLDEELFFTIREEVEPIEGYAYKNAREIRREGLGEKHEVFAIMTGKHLTDWYRDMKHCGRCGTKMVHSKRERAMQCPDCGYTAYPRIMPAVIVGVINGDRILLTKYRVGYANYALIAGFTEIGETMEETVAREVMEEAGIKVKNIRYYKSQPWGVANDILMGFYCEVDGDTEIHMDHQELKFAEWVKREAIELQPDDFSLTNEMMWKFKEGKEV